MGMRIGIVGAGAIGCVVGGLLTRAGHTPDPRNLEPLLKLVE
jgi:ketopantoate reductase